MHRQHKPVNLFCPIHGLNLFSINKKRITILPHYKLQMEFVKKIMIPLSTIAMHNTYIFSNDYNFTSH